MEIFEDLIIALRSAEVRSFKPWLGTVTRNHLHRKYKRESKIRTVAFDDGTNEVDAAFMEFADVGTPIHELGHTELMEGHLETALAQLKMEQKVCVKMFYLEKLSYTETCTRTGYSFKEVKSHIQNGKRNLKNILQELTNDGI